MGTVDEHLREQDKLNASFLGTIEAVFGDSELVRVTPYFGGTCACNGAMRLRKQDLELEPTPIITACCGKQLRVFRIQLKLGAQLPAADFVRHVQATATADPRRLSGCAKDCWSSYQGCLGSAGDDVERQLCDDGYGSCMEGCQQSPPQRARARVTGSCDCTSLYRRLALLQQELQHANPADKPDLLRRIERLWAQIDSCGC
jgi:hypothetical protein